MYKERPRCRKVIDGLLAKGYTLKEIAYWYKYDSDYWKKRKLDFLSVSKGLEIQSRKMLDELGDKMENISKEEIRNFMEFVFDRPVQKKIKEFGNWVEKYNIRFTKPIKNERERHIRLHALMELWEHGLVVGK